MLMRYAWSSAGDRTAWYCFTSPPNSATSDTPGTDRIRRRMSVLAKVCNSCDVCRAEVTEAKRISPMTDDVGAMMGGSTFSGSRSATDAIRSLTVWRAR